MIEIKEFRNAKYVNETCIDCEINHPTHGWIPFTVVPNDDGSDVNVQKLYEDLVKSNPDPYVPLTQEELDELKAKEVRRWRDFLLYEEVDSYVMNFMRWDEQPEEKQNKIRDYREKLLDVPQQEGFPHNITWPEKDF